MSALDAAELKLLKLLREKGPFSYPEVAGPEFNALMQAGLADWNSSERETSGWRKVRITAAGLAQLEAEAKGD